MQYSNNFSRIAKSYFNNVKTKRIRPLREISQVGPTGTQQCLLFACIHRIIPWNTSTLRSSLHLNAYKYRAVTANEIKLVPSRTPILRQHLKALFFLQKTGRMTLTQITPCFLKRSRRLLAKVIKEVAEPIQHRLAVSVL